jgi:hypothetical protein
MVFFGFQLTKITVNGFYDWRDDPLVLVGSDHCD